MKKQQPMTANPNCHGLNDKSFKWVKKQAKIGKISNSQFLVGLIEKAYSERR
jgi:hypothetical protein